VTVAESGRKPVTIRVVAERAGVSPAVVSFVLNNSQPVKQEKRERVLAAVAELGYEPSRAARSLRMNRTGTVGVLIPYLTNPTQAAMAASIEQALAERDHLAIICATGPREGRKHSYFRMLYATRVDGLLVYPTDDMRSDLETALERGVPVVHIFRELPLREGLAPDAVLVDHGSAIEEATTRLLDLGHRRIALVTLPTDAISGPERIEGYLRAFRARGIEPDPPLIHAGPGTVEGGRGLTAAALAHPDRPTAVVATASPQAIGALQAIQACGLRVPADVSLIGSNPTVSLASGFGLAVWDYPTEEIGRHAVDLLLDRRTGDRMMPPRRLVLRPTLQPGASIGPPPQ
jgi:LacI family transcriptional regulator